MNEPTGQAACVVPWYELNIMYNRRVSNCCYYNGFELSWRNDRAVDLFDYWNGWLIRRIRQEMAGQLPEAGCKECVFFRYKSPETSYAPSFFVVPEDATPLQRENWRLAQEAWQQRRIVVEHVPMRFYFNFGVGCNLDCVMCSQTGDRPDDTTLNPDILWTWREHYMRAERLSLIGGEPLALPSSLNFIRRVVADPDLDAVVLDLYTNAMTLERHLDMLSAKRKVSICVSLDGIGPTYEKIRRNGNWRQVERNLLDFKETAASKGLQWNVTTANLIMKTSLSSLEQLVDWHIAHDIQPNFSDFALAKGIEKTFLDENIFEFPHLLAEVPDWAQQFNAAARKLEAKGWWGGAAILRNMKMDLTARLFADRPQGQRG
jgi:sulfatase maturation enzyme AslB (radical SAM superfamily)